MRIKNNPKIFYLACGLLAEGDRRYDSGDAEITALADKIRKVAVDANILQWFNLAKTGQVEVNPYWPRGHAMLMATLFMEEGSTLDIEPFVDFLEGVDMTDPIGREEFIEWIGRLPEILTYAEGVFRDFWKEYCSIMFVRTNSWMPEIETSRLPLKEFFAGNVPHLVLVPNLFAGPYAADFVCCFENTVILVACKPDVESMLAKALHDKVVEHRGKIDGFARRHSIAAFADYDKMKDLGYTQDDDPAQTGRIIEECFVRALSTILSGGGEGRMQVHIKCGFVGLPIIAEHFARHRPKAENLGVFISGVLKDMTPPEPAEKPPKKKKESKKETKKESAKENKNEVKLEADQDDNDN